MRRRRGECAYCGIKSIGLTRDHVVPSCLYPPSKRSSRINRITVPACADCNHSWSDDEAHFRAVAVFAGEPDVIVRELWETKVLRSFDDKDGPRRIAQLLEHTVQVTVEGEDRLKIYPGRDDRVLRVVRKVIRGLSSFHKVETAVADDRVWADVLKFHMPSYLLDDQEVQLGQSEEDVFKYSYIRGEDEQRSFWILTFFDRLTFVGIVDPPTAAPI